jgi:hypothetical protein
MMDNIYYFALFVSVNISEETRIISTVEPAPANDEIMQGTLSHTHLPVFIQTTASVTVLHSDENGTHSFQWVDSNHRYFLFLFQVLR